MTAALLSIKAVEAFLGVSRKTVLQAVRRGKLKASKVEHQWRFKPGDVDAYLEAQAVTIAPRREPTPIAAHRRPAPAKTTELKWKGAERYIS